MDFKPTYNDKKQTHAGASVGFGVGIAAKSKQQLKKATIQMMADTHSPLWKLYFDAYLFLAVERSSDDEVAEYAAMIKQGDDDALWQRISAKVTEQDTRNIAGIVGSKFAEIIAAQHKEVAA